MSEGQIRILIDAKGGGRIVTEGSEGAKCLDFAKALEDAMGADQSTIEYTAEFFSKNRERAVILRQGGGE